MQKVTLYCDSHHILKDEMVVVEVSKEFNLGEGSKSIELCAECEQSISLKDLREILELAGRSVVQQRPAKKALGSGKGFTSSNPKVPHGDYPCRFCGEMTDSPQGRGMHEFRNHPWQRLLWERDTDYVAKNKIKGDDLERRKKWFAQLDRIGLTLDEAAKREIAIGPPAARWSPDRVGAANRIAVK